MRNKQTFSVFIAMLITSVSFCQNENPQAIRALKRAIGPTIAKYTTYSTPTNNFGIGTSCKRKWIPKGTMICDMVECFGLDRNEQNTATWKSVNGFAFYGEPGPLVLDDSLNRSYGLGILLPKILKVLNLNMDMNIGKIKSVQITIDSAVLRYLNYNTYKNYVLSNQNPSLLSAWNNGSLLVVTSDYVLLDYSLEVNPVDTFGINLSAKLDSISNSNSQVLNGNDSLGIKIERRSSGHFSLKSSRPVVFAVYIQKKRKIEGQGIEENFDKWPVVEQADNLSPSSK